jgi:uncharacterized membrane protein YcaP (DUF421 family)
VDYLLTIDWSKAFSPQLSLAEALIRATVVYFLLLALLRIVPKWQSGPGNIASLLFVVLLGGLAADAVKGPAESITDILLLIAIVIVWVYVVDWLSYRSEWFRFLAQDSPTCLIRDGRILHQNLRREMISEDDLKSQLRRQDVEDITNVREAQLEADGSISVVKKEDKSREKPAHTTSPEEASATSDTVVACDPLESKESTASKPDEMHENNGQRAGTSPARSNESAPGAGAELSDFLAAARRLQARLEWHQDQLVSLQEALVLNGVRIKPSPTGQRGKVLAKGTRTATHSTGESRASARGAASSPGPR